MKSIEKKSGSPSGKGEPLFCLFLISSPLAADIFEPCSRTDNMGGADGFDGGADRNGDMAQMHTDQGVTDIDPGVCLDIFHSAWMLEFVPCGGGEGAACL